jgi:Ca2+-binding EF-hand superfamily protein
VGWLSNLTFYFRKFDLDGSGTLSPVEIVAALRSLGITKKIQQENIAIQEMFTGFRKATHEMSLAAFVRDMPEYVQRAQRRGHSERKREMACWRAPRSAAEHRDRV